jgi:SAM-dependent methyltransferase
MKMTTEEAVLALRADPGYAELVRDAYLGADVEESARRFHTSAEFDAVRRLLPPLRGASVLDVGAGAGIASYAFAREGAATVFALEPDPSEHVGRGAIARLGLGPAVQVVDGVGESIAVADETFDIVYARQVLHHAHDLVALMREAARVAKPGATLLACREHVVDSEADLATFLSGHPVHRLAGGEGAYPLDDYVGAIRAGGWHLERVLGPLDSVINAFPVYRTEEELALRARRLLAQRFGSLGRVASRLPGADAAVNRFLDRQRAPGRMYSFLARKPSSS